MIPIIVERENVADTSFCFADFDMKSQQSNRNVINIFSVICNSIFCFHFNSISADYVCTNVFDLLRSLCWFYGVKKNNMLIMKIQLKSSAEICEWNLKL